MPGHVDDDFTSANRVIFPEQEHTRRNHSTSFVYRANFNPVFMLREGHCGHGPNPSHLGQLRLWKQ